MARTIVAWRKTQDPDFPRGQELGRLVVADHADGDNPRQVVVLSGEGMFAEGVERGWLTTLADFILLSAVNPGATDWCFVED